MWFSRFLLGRRSTPGHQWIGKHRRIKKISPHQKLRKKKEAQMIERVERLLSAPYLSLAEEEHQTLARERRDSYVPKWVSRKLDRWMNRDNKPFNVIS